MFDNDNYEDRYKKNKSFDNTCMLCASPNIVKCSFQIPNPNITRYHCNDCKEDFSVIATTKKILD